MWAGRSGPKSVAWHTERMGTSDGFRDSSLDWFRTGRVALLGRWADAKLGDDSFDIDRVGRKPAHLGRC